MDWDVLLQGLEGMEGKLGIFYKTELFSLGGHLQVFI